MYHYEEQYFNFNTRKYDLEKTLYCLTFPTEISLWGSAKQAIYYYRSYDITSEWLMKQIQVTKWVFNLS